MPQPKHATLDMIYKELKAVRSELQRVECAVIPVERLSEHEIKAHKKDLEDALKGERVDFREL